MDALMSHVAAEPLLALVAARNRLGVIGRNGALPWALSTDLRRFKAITIGKPVLMGRRTWDSLGRPLAGRANLVLTSDTHTRLSGAWAFSSLETLLAAGRAMALRAGAAEVCVIGGGGLYAAALARADRLYLTEVDDASSGDAWFPSFADADYIEVAREAAPAGPKDAHAMVFRTLDRRARVC